MGYVESQQQNASSAVNCGMSFAGFFDAKKKASEPTNKASKETKKANKPKKASEPNKAQKKLPEEIKSMNEKSQAPKNNPAQTQERKGKKRRRPDVEAGSTKHRKQGYNFEGANFLDHFETPAQAYRDIAPALTKIAAKAGIDPAKLRVYDPYFCKGSVKEHLGSLGFASVYNENEDFYSSTRFTDLSLFDVVVTNPPYSGDHKEKCMNWLRQANKPFFCLMWAFAATKQWYTNHDDAPTDWFIAPTSKLRYDFRSPSGKGMDGGSPYMPLWFCNTSGIESQPSLARSLSKSNADNGVKVISSLAAYRLFSNHKKRGNPKQRRKKLKQAAAGGSAA